MQTKRPDSLPWDLEQAMTAFQVHPLLTNLDLSVSRMIKSTGGPHKPGTFERARPSLPQLIVLPLCRSDAIQLWP
jgi:hypothetical protein